MLMFAPFRYYRNDVITGILRTLVALILMIYLWEDTTVYAQEIITNTTTDIANGGNSDSSGCNSNTDYVIPINDSATPSDYMLFPWFVQLLGCCSLFLLTRFNCPIPYASCMFIWGAIMGIVSTNLSQDNHLNDSITEWINFDSELLLMVFLPGLLFKEAVEVPINLFQVASGMLLSIQFNSIQF
jgi:hypothetical protein